MQSFILPESLHELQEFHALLCSWALSLHQSIKDFDEARDYQEYHEMVLNFQILWAAIVECGNRIQTEQQFNELYSIYHGLN